MTKIEWTSISPSPDSRYGVPCARSSHGVSFIGSAEGGTSGRLIIFGGEHTPRTPVDNNEACWAVDWQGSEASWRWIDCSSNSPSPRLAHAQAVHRQTNLYIFGGRAGMAMNEQAMNDLFVLDCSGQPGTEKWSLIIPSTTSDAPPEARSFHRMVCIGDSLYVFGGCGAEHTRLADFFRFDIVDKTWHNLGSSLLRGRGGANLFPIASGKKLAVVSGFCGEETADGQIYSVTEASWADSILSNELTAMRPRSVCVSGSFPSVGVSLIFGGEVDPSDRGHEGAGGFESDIVLMDEQTAVVKNIVRNTSSTSPWPEQRGWSDAAAVDHGDGTGSLFMFGGLTGDDTDPKRLGDLWRLDLKKEQ